MFSTKILLRNCSQTVFLSRNYYKTIQKQIPQMDINYFKNFKNLDVLSENVKLRNGPGNVELIKKLINKLETETTNENDRVQLIENLEKEIFKLPNNTHPAAIACGDTPKCLQICNPKPEFSFKPKSFNELAKKLNLYRMDHLGNLTGHKSYYLMNTLAEMETALIRFAVDDLLKRNFQLISVPDILPSETIEACGMATTGDRNQVYKLAETDECLSGTAEMALAGYFTNKILEEENLPIKLTAASRCFRAETSGLQEEKGLYRVHQFTKVEMFSICMESQSDEVLESFKNIEIELFQRLGLHFQVLDMPPCELGTPAYRKYDMEAWMPGRNMWGEISSCSNCTNYQTKRLNIKYRTKKGSIEYAHSVNGTACAIPRLLLTLLETNQKENGTITIPEVLQQYLRGQNQITRQKILPELKLVKRIRSPDFD